MLANAFEHADLHMRQLLNALQHLETATSALSPQGIRRVGDSLKLVEDKRRNEQRAVEEMSFADIRNAPVNEHARVQQLRRACIQRVCVFPSAAQQARVEPQALAAPENHAK